MTPLVPNSACSGRLCLHGGLAPTLVVLLLSTSAVCAADWPRFLGPTRDGVYAGSDVRDAWGADGPPIVWKASIGQGFSGPVVADGRLILFHRRGDREIVECFDVATGRSLWSTDAPTRYKDDFGFDPGPRATPTIEGDRVFTFGAAGRLDALDVRTGKRIWSVDTQTKFKVRKGFFGAACSPLVEGDLVLVNVGGPDGAGLVAFDAADGKVRWTATDDAASHSSPVAVTIQGQRHALFFTRAGLVGVEPTTGRVRYKFPFRARINASVNAATPLVMGDRIFLSASYRTGAVLLRAHADRVEPIWRVDDVLSNHYATSVHRDGFLYGFDGRQEYGPSLCCVELATGKARWKQERFGAGTVTLVGDRLLILGETGQLTLAAARPDGYRAQASARPFTGTFRAYPALANGRIYARNEDTLWCVDLSAKK